LQDALLTCYVAAENVGNKSTASERFQRRALRHWPLTDRISHFAAYLLLLGSRSHHGLIPRCRFCAGVVMMPGGSLSGLIWGHRQETEVASPNASISNDDLERQSQPPANALLGYGSLDNNNIHTRSGGGALLPGAEPPDRPGAPTPTDEREGESEEETVQSLTQRLRCLFTVLTVSAQLAFHVSCSLSSL
jgi:hypothetical protein